jgi:hypothetical protein
MVGDSSRSDYELRGVWLTSSTIGVPGTAKPAKTAARRKKKEASTPKQPKIRAKKEPAKPLVKKEEPTADGSASSGTDDSDDESDLEVLHEPSPLPAVRPEDVEGGVKYDTLKAVWSPRNMQPAASAVRDAMKLFSDLVKGVRDAWKSRSEALKAAENQNLEDSIPIIKKDVILQRRLLDLIVNTTLESGHPVLIQRYVHFPFIMFLAGCFHYQSDCRWWSDHGEYYYVNTT